jgi:multidrug resistance efflux pump
LAVVAVVAGIVYWFRFSPVPVKVHSVGVGEIVAEVMGTGTLEAHFKATISPRISGRLQEVLVDMGDHVSAGQVLARLDDVELKPQVEMAEASVTVSQATLDTLQADRDEALAVVDQAKANHERALRLLPGGAISQEEVEKFTADWKKAKAGLARSEAAIIEGQKQLIA